MAVMKTAPQSITFTLSKTLTRQLQELSHITQIKPEAVINNFLEISVGAPLQTNSSLRLEMMLGPDRRYETENQANKVTDNYNAYAERMGFY
ncbi:MAG: hypothetical protein QOH31_1917 [Verrucomicrobiota bacterium]